MPPLLRPNGTSTSSKEHMLDTLRARHPSHHLTIGGQVGALIRRFQSVLWPGLRPDGRRSLHSWAIASLGPGP